LGNQGTQKEIFSPTLPKIIMGPKTPLNFLGKPKGKKLEKGNVKIAKNKTFQKRPFKLAQFKENN